MLAYLRGPDVVAGYIELWAGTSPSKIMFLLVVLFVIVGDFVDAVPAMEWCDALGVTELDARRLAG